MRFFIGAALLLLSSPVGACRLDIPATALHGRVARLDLTVRHAATTVTNLPAGWNLSVTNDPAWTTTVRGHAIVGAAFLSGQDLPALLAFTPEPGMSCEDLSSARAAAVSLVFYKNDRFLRFRIAGPQVRFMP